MIPLKLKRLVHTTAVRTALRYAGWYALLAGAALAVFFWSTSHYVDAQLRAGLEEEFFLLRNRLETEGQGALVRLVSVRSQEADRDGRYYLLVDAAGRKLAGNLHSWPPDSPIRYDGSVHTVWVEDDIIPGQKYDDDAFWPVIATRFGDGSRLLMARSVQQAASLQMFSLYALFAILAVIVLLSVAMGISMGRSILWRIDAISDTAQDIMGGQLSQRISVSERNDEFDVLAQQLNQMLERIEQLLKGMREVTDNVAHDLRSPLTRLRNRLEVTLLERRDEQEYRDVIERAIQDADGLVAIFNAILQVAQADAGAARGPWETVDLAELAIKFGELYEPLVEEKGQHLDVEASPPQTVLGNRGLLAQVLGNLLDNAIKYTPEHGYIAVSVHSDAAGITLTVADSGPGIPQAACNRVLERFVRLDGARSTAGNGLGLSLVSAIARLHHAELQLRDNQPGLRVELRFERRSGSSTVTPVTT